jgi:competence protein ComEA
MLATLRLFTLSAGLLCGAAAVHGADHFVDLNRANQAELEMVKGIGPQLSERILAERARGDFADWGEFIGRMKGLGPTHAVRLSAAGLRIAGQAYAGSTAAERAPAK